MYASRNELLFFRVQTHQQLKTPTFIYKNFTSLVFKLNVEEPVGLDQ